MSSLLVQDCIEECLALAKGWKQRPNSAVTTIVIHRFDVKDVETGLEAAKFFQDRKHGTGGQMPYHIFIREDGQADQCLPIRFVGNAAKGLNQNGVQIALRGDFRKRPPTSLQWSTASQVCAILCRAYQINPDTIGGHTDKAGNSNDPGKVCPGDKFNMTGFRFDVEEKLFNATLKLLLNYGISA